MRALIPPHSMANVPSVRDSAGRVYHIKSLIHSSILFSSFEAPDASDVNVNETPSLSALLTLFFIAGCLTHYLFILSASHLPLSQ